MEARDWLMAIWFLGPLVGSAIAVLVAWGLGSEETRERIRNNDWWIGTREWNWPWRLSLTVTALVLIAGTCVIWAIIERSSP